MNRKILFVILAAFSAAYFAGCSSNPRHLSITLSTPPPASIVPNGTAQIVATETGTTAPIDWTCTPVGACGSFSPTPTTSGQGTTYTAPATAGPVTITATSEAKSAPSASANVTIQTNQGIAGAFAFYVTGFDVGQSTYSVAGAVLINADGTLTGEQDYNNGFDTASPASGDMITSGSLSIGADGTGTLTLVTDNVDVGVSGTETFAVNFVNNSHALIVQADGSATSSGSLDLQTLPSTLGNNFAFATTGVGPIGFIVTTGGVFTLTGGTAIAGTVDVNDATAGTDPSLGNPFTGTMVAADSFGRGTITTDNAELGTTLAYYVIGPEAIRLVVTGPGVTQDGQNPATAAVGSAFGQGAGTFSNASLVNSVFTDQANFGGNLYAAVGEIFPAAGGAAVRSNTVHRQGVPVTNSFTGVADVNETASSSLDPFFLDAASISGTYFILSDGYGGLTIDDGDLLDVTTLGIYMVDPAINVNDPNNPSGGGGALVVDLSPAIAGVGVLVPQTDNTTASFAGGYTVALQDFFPAPGNPLPISSGEVDFVGNAAVTTTLTGGGTLSDPRTALGLGTSDTVSFSAPISPDASNLGRYEITPFTLSISNGGAPITVPFIANAYQASGGQLFWIEDGADGLSSVFGGQLQQESALGAAAVKKVKKP